MTMWDFLWLAAQDLWALVREVAVLLAYCAVVAAGVWLPLLILLVWAKYRTRKKKI